jgi:hypothetical protein
LNPERALHFRPLLSLLIPHTAMFCTLNAR